MNRQPCRNCGEPIHRNEYGTWRHEYLDITYCHLVKAETAYKNCDRRTAQPTPDQPGDLARRAIGGPAMGGCGEFGCECRTRGEVWEIPATYTNLTIPGATEADQRRAAGNVGEYY